MARSPFIAVLDANVLFPLTLRDTPLRAAAAGFYQLRWSADIQNDPKDRHVVAAALEAGAQVIVTSNLKDFMPLPEGLDTQSPDNFLLDLFESDPVAFVELLREQAGDLVKPPVTFDELLARLDKTVPEFVSAVRAETAPPLEQ
jgi:hypothetical protein